MSHFTDAIDDIDAGAKRMVGERMQQILKKKQSRDIHPGKANKSKAYIPQVLW